MFMEFICKYCEKVCKNLNSLRNHERLCKFNPNRQLSVFITNNPNSETSWNKGKTKASDSRVATQAAAQSRTKKGKLGRKQSEETKAKLRQHALKNQLGGFHMRRGIYYKGIKLDSSYEVTLAENLDVNNIRWERCKRFPYIKDDKLHYYTPDFYLTDYDVYLDPKNDYLINNINPILGYSDEEKIKLASEQNGIKVLILNKDQLNWQDIKNLMPL